MPYPVQQEGSARLRTFPGLCGEVAAAAAHLRDVRLDFRHPNEAPMLRRPAIRKLHQNLSCGSLEVRARVHMLVVFEWPQA